MLLSIHIIITLNSISNKLFSSISFSSSSGELSLSLFYLYLYLSLSFLFFSRKLWNYFFVFPFWLLLCICVCVCVCITEICKDCCRIMSDAAYDWLSTTCWELSVIYSLWSPLHWACGKFSKCFRAPGICLCLNAFC